MPGNPLNITLPTVGVTPGPDFAAQIELAIRTIVEDLEAKVTPDEILVNANLSFRANGVSYSAVDLKSLILSAQAGAVSGPDTNVLYSLNGELYFRDSFGVNIAITSSGSVAGATGNIGSTGSPAYSTAGIEILWSGGDGEYRLKSGSDPNELANLVLAELHLRNGANTFKLKAAVTTDYEVIWPATSPGDNDLAYFDASGNMTFSSAIPGTKTFTGQVNTQNGLEVDGALNANDLITASLGIEVAGGENVAVSAAGKYLHGNRNNSLPMVPLEPPGTGITLSNGWFFSSSSGTSDKLILQISPGHLHNVKSVTFNYRGDASDRFLCIVKKLAADGTVTTLVTGYGTYATGPGSTTVAIPALEQAFDSTALYTVEFSRYVGAGNDLTLRSVSYDWDNA